MKNVKISQTIISLQHLYEHEMKIDKFYHDFVNASKSINYTMNYLCYTTKHALAHDYTYFFFIGFFYSF